jgi:hypothetical protein
MPIDPSIPLQTRGAQAASPMQLMSEVLQVKRQQDAISDRESDRAWQDTQRQQQQEDRGRQNAVRDAERMTPLGADGQPDAKAIAGEVGHIDARAAMDWWEKASAQDKEKLARTKALASEVGSAAGAVLGVPPERRPQAYAAARAGMIERGLLTAEQVPEQYDEAWLTQHHREALTVGQQIDAAEKAVDQELARRKAEADAADKVRNDRRLDDNSAETKRHNQSMERSSLIRAQRTGSGSGSDGGSWATVTETLPDGSTVTRRERVHDGDTVGNKPAPDNAALPRGVESYLTAMLDKGYTRAQANQELKQAWSQMARQHPRMSRLKVTEAMDALWKEDTGLLQPGEKVPPAPGVGGSAAPAAAPTAAPGPAPSRPQPKIGDVVTVRGQKVKVTGVGPDGKMTGVPVP